MQHNGDWAWATDESLQHLQYYDPSNDGDFPRKITSSSSAHLCVKLLLLWLNGFYDRTNKGKIDDYRRWNLNLKVKRGPKTHLQLLIITKGAVKNNEMKNNEIMTLSKSTKVLNKVNKVYLKHLKVKVLIMQNNIYDIIRL